MVYLKITIAQDLYNKLSSQGPEAIKDYGFDYLYNKGYIKSDREYKGCFLHRTDDRYEIILRTQKYEGEYVK